MKLLIAFCLVGVALAKPQRHNPEEGEFYQGDIVLPLPKMSKNGLIDERYRWPDGVVPFVWGDDFTSERSRAIVQKAMDEYDTITDGCITFVPRTTQRDYVIYNKISSKGCSSNVGKVGGRQRINYARGCLGAYGTVQHEMLHALGFFHEQSRTDRDDYVMIHWDNIQNGAQRNFEKYDADTITAFGQPYDYESVMHYPGTAFSKNGELTIETLDPEYQDVIGQRDGVSDIDIIKLMAMYNCDTKKRIKKEE